MISLNEISHSFESRRILKKISVTLAEQRIGIIGANGSGKSSLVRLLNGLLIADEGDVRVFGLDPRKDLKQLRRRVGFVFQNPDAQIVMPTVFEDLAFGLKNHGMKKAERDERCEAMMQRYDLKKLEKQSAHLLSGGEKQMLALAGVLALEPDLILLDEPTTLLDLRNRRRIRQTIDELDQQVIMVTHELDLLDGFDRVLLIHEGELVADGAPEEIIPRYEVLLT